MTDRFLRLVFAIEWESLVQRRGEAVTDVTCGGVTAPLCCRLSRLCRVVAHIPALAWNRMKPTMNPSPTLQGGVDDGSLSSRSASHVSKVEWELHPLTPRGDTGRSQLAPFALQVTQAKSSSGLGKHFKPPIRLSVPVSSCQAPSGVLCSR